MDLQQNLALLPLWYVAFLLSLTCHEAAHAFVSHRAGDPTAYLAGQVTLNPLPHVRREPFGTVLVPLITFLQAGWMMGWASAPYDPLWAHRHPRRAALMALAGPAANLLLMCLAFGILRGGLDAGWWNPAPVIGISRLVEPAAGASGALDGAGRFLSVLLMLNLVLFLFNLFPFPPMDGSALLAGFVPAVRRLNERLHGSPLPSLIGLVVAWAVFPYVFGPAAVWVIGTLFS